MPDKISVPPQIALGEEDAVLSRSGQSRKVVAKILGRRTDPHTGLATVWLDRLIQRPGEEVLAQGDVLWAASGAISTVLTQKEAVAQAPA